MPDYSEPTFSPAGVPDELSAAGQRDAYVASRRNSYAQAHLEADAAELLAELDERRNDDAAADLTPEQFAAAVEADAPGVLFSMTATAYVANRHGGPPAIERKLEGWAKFDGAPVRHLAAGTWRELARAIIEEHKARRGLRALPVVSTEAAAV